VDCSTRTGRSRAIAHARLSAGRWSAWRPHHAATGGPCPNAQSLSSVLLPIGIPSALRNARSCFLVRKGGKTAFVRGAAEVSFSATSSARADVCRSDIWSIVALRSVGKFRAIESVNLNAGDNQSTPAAIAGASNCHHLTWKHSFRSVVEEPASFVEERASFAGTAHVGRLPPQSRPRARPPLPGMRRSAEVTAAGGLPPAFAPSVSPPKWCDLGPGVLDVKK
jgi:hypothetical protein